MTKPVHLHYCQTEEDHFPMAITRFTSYDSNKKPICVEQVTYESNIDYLERQVIILTTLPIDEFKRLHRIFQTAR
jgi:hypothetical protein